MADFDFMHLAGMVHTFEDGIQLRIVQVKQREGELWVTSEHLYPGAFPRRYVNPLHEFMGQYGHLFNTE